MFRKYVYYFMNLAAINVVEIFENHKRIWFERVLREFFSSFRFSLQIMPSILLWRDIWHVTWYKFNMLFLFLMFQNCTFFTSGGRNGVGWKRFKIFYFARLKEYKNCENLFKFFIFQQIWMPHKWFLVVFRFSYWHVIL